MKKTLHIITLIVLISIIFILFAPSYLSKVANADAVEITIPEGATLTYVSNTLFDKGVIKSKTWFRHKAKEAEIDRKIKPGTYLIPADCTIEHIFTLIEKGIPDEHIVLTIPEGFTLYQIAQRVEELGFGTKEQFVEATEKYFNDNNYNFDTKDLFFKLEGYLYPDTYYFTKNQTIDDIVNKLVQTMDNVFTEKYKKRAKELNLSIHEVLTIASLIEREAKHDGERSAISGVIYNRLNTNMILQIDATVIYGVGKGKEHNSTIYKSDLNKNAPFNTYKIPSLPPGPIASPGKESIHAALYPEKHEYFYYVLSTKEDGHIFTKTLKEHEKYAAEYRNRNKK